MRRRREVIGRLHATFQEVNERHFAGLLPTLPIYLGRLGTGRAKVRELAHLWVDDDTGAPRYLKFDEEIALTSDWSDLRETLVHEMVHLWQSVQGWKVDHGPEFKRMAKRLGISERAID